MIVTNNNNAVHGYRFTLWTSCFRNKKWSHTSERTVIIDAVSKDKAEQMLELRDEYEYIDFSTSKESIRRIEDLGLKRCRVEFYYEPCKHNWKADYAFDTAIFRCSICGAECYEPDEDGQ